MSFRNRSRSFCFFLVVLVDCVYSSVCILCTQLSQTFFVFFSFESLVVVSQFAAMPSKASKRKSGATAEEVSVSRDRLLADVAINRYVEQGKSKKAKTKGSSKGKKNADEASGEAESSTKGKKRSVKETKKRSKKAGKAKEVCSYDCVVFRVAALNQTACLFHDAGSAAG